MLGDMATYIDDLKKGIIFIQFFELRTYFITFSANFKIEDDGTFNSCLGNFSIFHSYLIKTGPRAKILYELNDIYFPEEQKALWLQTLGKTFDVLNVDSDVYALCSIPNNLLALLMYEKANVVLRESHKLDDIRLARKTIEKLRKIVFEQGAPEMHEVGENNELVLPNDFEEEREVGEFPVDQARAKLQHRSWLTEWKALLLKLARKQLFFAQLFGPSSSTASQQSSHQSTSSPSSQHSTSSPRRQQSTSSPSTQQITPSTSTSGVHRPINRLQPVHARGRGTLPTFAPRDPRQYSRAYARVFGQIENEENEEFAAQHVNLNNLSYSPSMSIHSIYYSVLGCYSRRNLINKISLRTFERHSPIMFDRMQRNLLTTEDVGNLKSLAGSRHVLVNQIRGIAGTTSEEPNNPFTFYFFYDETANTTTIKVAKLILATAKCLSMDLMSQGARPICCEAVFDGYVPPRLISLLLKSEGIAFRGMHLRTRSLPNGSVFTQNALTARYSLCRFILPLLERGAVNVLLPHGRRN